MVPVDSIPASRAQRSEHVWLRFESVQTHFWHRLRRV